MVCLPNGGGNEAHSSGLFFGEGRLRDRVPFGWSTFAELIFAEAAVLAGDFSRPPFGRAARQKE